MSPLPAGGEATTTATGTGSGPQRASARERLLAAADELFYAEGIQAVGVDRIVRHAGVAKASLYNLFGSKEQLEAAYLASRHEATTARLTETVSRFDDPRQKILAVFDSQAARIMHADFRGGAFAAASTEAPAGGLVERAADRFRAWMRDFFTDLAEQAGAHDPESLGRQLLLLCDGASVAARMDHRDPAIPQCARDAVGILLAAALPARDQNQRWSNVPAFDCG
jgi:AcrR family transcriptional regulator